MTQDVIALTPEMPDAGSVLAGLYAGGPDLRVSSSAEGAVVHLRTQDGRCVVTVEVPLFVQVPGEIRRLLGAGAGAEAPVWWTEVRATTAVAEAERLAGAVAGRLTALLGGSTWPADAAHTDVVAVPSEDGGSPVDSPLAVDVLTPQAAVILQDRPVVAATTWLTDLLQNCIPSGREVQIVTPPGTRLTLPVRTLLTKVPARWIVRDPDCGYYDGLTGAVLHWHEGRFTHAVTLDGRTPIADAFHSGAGAGGQDEQQLHLSIRTTHPAVEDLLLGGALEAAWQTLTGAPPAGWSTAEPVNQPWSPRQLTELARNRAKKAAPTWLVAVGTPDSSAIATCRIVHTPVGVEEHITLAVGHTSDRPPPLDNLPVLAETLATRHNLTSMLTHLRPARADLTTPPHHEPPPVPLSFTLGADAVRAVGRTHAETFQHPRPTRLGPATRSALHYTLGNGTDPTAWQRLQDLNNHLQSRQ
ncbi:hypothetical protein J7E96_30195 [Streptomyces sp. ISL-96]|uniref:DUF6177 family protein n=1 Tax=Streptomyces sp. ISL-96 TaxID=2819191 RepID=UPI001BE87136|nr:DUF6177 family protein [Streptomyces sp. ISL-96]MBT2492707.1 hypothetical protein [Streptomyces sp. ISL-96]